MSRTSGFACSRCITSSVYHPCTWAVKQVQHLWDASYTFGCNSWTNESLLYLDRFSGVEGRMLWETWHVCCGELPKDPAGDLMAFGTTSFQAAWTWHKESLVKTVSSPLDLEKWRSQKNVLHVIVNMSMARISHHCWYSCYPKLM